MSADDDLQKFAEALTPEPEKELVKATLPNPVEAGYAHPNKDGSRKNCGNCCLFLVVQKLCTVVQGKISPKGMCSYHVFGEPRRVEDYNIPQPAGKMDQVLAGYVNSVPNGGTSCDTCKAYRGDAKGGVCVAVQKDGKPAKVEPKGCCNRWKLKPR